MKNSSQTSRNSILSLSMQQNGVVLSSDPVIRTHAVFAVALRGTGHEVILGNVLIRALVVTDHDDVGVDHVGSALGTRQPERDVLIVPDTTRHLDLYVVAYHHPSYLNTTGQKFDAVAELGCLGAARL